MILRHCLAAVVLLLCSSYSYSEIIQGSTSNAASNLTTNVAGNGLVWQAQSVLPPQAGLVVNGLIYSYTAVKQKSDNLSVTVQNENALQGGYLFQKTDNWDGLRGTKITNVYTFENIPREYWGRGEIIVEGNGAVQDAYVAYNYRFDTCYNPQSDPRCPGYRDPSSDFTTDYTLTSFRYDEDSIYLNDNNYIPADYNDLQEEKISKNIDEKNNRLNLASKSRLLTDEALKQAAQLEALNNIESFSSYYYTIQGGVYNDTLTIRDANLPDNKQGLRVNFAQQVLHRRMVEMQYADNNK